jgi:murein DD-endopeptidase MepM/ murein hydrolase activator NlpD
MSNELNPTHAALKGLLIPAALVLIAVASVQLTAVTSSAAVAEAPAAKGDTTSATAEAATAGAATAADRARFTDVEWNSYGPHGGLADLATLPARRYADHSPRGAAGERVVLEERVDSVVVRRGDTLLELLSRGGLSHQAALDVAEAIAPIYNPSRLRPGQEVRFVSVDRTARPLEPVAIDAESGMYVPVSRYAQAPSGAGGRAPSAASRGAAAGAEAQTGLHEASTAEIAGPERIEIVTSVENRIVVRRTAEEVTAELEQNPLTTREVVATGRVITSLYGAGRQAGLTNALLMDLINLLAFEVDFQREIHPGDTFRVLYEQHLDTEGNVVRTGNLLAAEVRFRHDTIRMYRFTDKSGRTDYFDSNGITIRKTLLRTPVDGARITSGYGYRRHPVRGFSHLHRGIDFAGPVGTPVYAAGSGRIIEREYTRGFGNHLMIRHRNGYRTLYAHLNGFARGMFVGREVEQGQLIGFLGNTGLSTGPHLHYEVHLNGTSLNPASLQFPPERSLAGAQRRSFDAARDALDRLLHDRAFHHAVLTD